MEVKIKIWKELPLAERAKLFARSEADITEITSLARGIVDEVRTKKDAALVRFAREFDNSDLSPDGLLVTGEEYGKAAKILSSDVKAAIDFAVHNVTAFHNAQKPHGITMQEILPGVMAGERAVPIDSAGLYVPRGRGSFPSMLYMLAVPAKIAAVPSVVVTTPPLPDGSIDPACLYAAKLCGVHKVYKAGGAQAIAALAYGTESIEKVVKIIGPGSKYVAAAKRIVGDFVDTGLPAGPSESIILADESADPYTTALDLLIEAEHGLDSSALLITPSRKVAEETAEYLGPLINGLPEPRKTFVEGVFSGYGGIILTEDMIEAVEIVNEFAAEHLQVRTKDPFDTLGLIRNAGEILLGENVPFSAANYTIGANAVLPTGGKARSCSAVSVRDFLKFSSVVYVSGNGYKRLKKPTITLADYEGFPAHGDALRRRTNKNE